MKVNNKTTMYGFPRPLMPNEVQWNGHRSPHNPQWRPFHRPRAPFQHFQPRNQGYSNHRPPMLESSEEHWCETCDRGFPNEDLLRKHKQQHQKCNIDGCQFIAHPKVITKHIQMQHSSGLYKKIAKLNNPEEIEKWREERRKKYPTKIHIDKKAAELKEKIDRGEKMNLGRRDWQSKRDENNQNRDHSGQGIKRPYNNQPASKFRKPRKQTPKILPTLEETRSLAPFAGIQHLGMDSDEEDNEGVNCDDLIEDDEIETIEKDLETSKSDKSTIVEKHVVCSALSSLMCEYESSADELDDIQMTDQHLKEGTKKEGKDAMSQIKGQGSITQQTNKYNKTSQDLPKEVKYFNKIEETDQKLDQQNNSTESCKVLPINLDSNDLTQNTVAKENTSNSRKSEELAKHDSNEKNHVNINDDDDDSGPEEVKVDKNNESAKENNDSIEQENNSKIVKKKVEMVRRKPVYRKPKPKVPSTLIYKLLSKEMKQERNQVLQCIRYIRKNNYFEKSNK